MILDKRDFGEYGSFSIIKRENEIRIHLNINKVNLSIKHLEEHLKILLLALELAKNEEKKL